MTRATQRFRKKIVIVGVALAVGLLHFVTGKQYSGPFPRFVNGYLIDILLPFAAYLLLCNIERPPINRWWIRCLAVFGLGAAVEMLQFFGVPVFGRTFDPWDFAAYGAGVMMAAFADLILFPRVFSFWKDEPEETRE